MVQRLQAVKKDQLLGLDTFSEEEFRYLALTIQDKHNALVQLSEQLEDEVERKTKELQELNETLEEKVRDAVNDLQLKEQLLQQQSRFAQMGEMLSMIAHQWRQPLGAISASTVGIQTKMALKKYDMEEASDREKFESYLTKKLEAIQEYVRLLSDTIEDFRKFFRHEKERKVLQINEPIERVLHILESLIEKNSITIVKTLQSEKKLAVLQNEFMQVVMNILTNASDALVENREERREVSIHTYDTEESVVVEICDNGGGISEEIVGKVFDPYFSTKDEKNGTGLGLYMSKLIIEEHHDAMLRVNSEGEHSCFMIKFLIDKKVQGTA
ncbi:MAG TPA: GHKL domain-containing protein [Epsilonproteobacteria bacterium]|nr:GHKL domain-containing protein [Campylobacterota bacterium]